MSEVQPFHLWDSQGDTKENPNRVQCTRLYDLLISTKYKAITEAYRSTDNPELKRNIKAAAPCATISGTFRERKADQLIQHSNLICIDIDKKDNLNIDFSKLKESLKKDQYVRELFTSISGMGIAIIVRIDGQKHLESFKALSGYLKETYHIEVDQACKDVSRLRYLCHDPEAWYNEQAILFDRFEFIKRPGRPSKHKVQEGGRNSWLHNQGIKLVVNGNQGDELITKLRALNIEHCTPPLNDDEVDTIARSVTKAYEEGKIEKIYRFTHLGHAERFMDLYKEQVLYVPETNNWMIWTGQKWQKADKSTIIILLTDMLKQLETDTKHIQDEQAWKAWIKWIDQSQSSQSISGVYNLIKSLMAATISDFDKNDELLNCQNGTLNLKTLQLKPHDSKDRCMKSINASYNVHSTCPEWLAFLNMIFQGKQELIDYVQKALGYTISPEIVEKCLFIMYGEGGNNGKSTFINVLRTVFKDYYHATDSATFLDWNKNASSASPQLAALVGKRCVTTSEIEKGRKISESFIKCVTGGDTITARDLYSQPFTFEPIFKVWLAVNDYPYTTSTGNPFWRRVKIIPFNYSIPQDKQIPFTEAMRRFDLERDGIFTWIIEGYRKWKEEGLEEPEEVKKQGEAYRQEMDQIGTFLDEVCQRTESWKDRVRSTTLYDMYRTWCQSSGENPTSHKHFNHELRKKQIPVKKTHGVLVWFKLKIIHEVAICNDHLAVSE